MATATTTEHEEERYTIISADCHAGADLTDYRDYLEQRYHDRFDDWARDYAIPYRDLMGPEADKNWNSERRLANLEADGIVAEVLFPNTIPPFYPEPSLKAQQPGASEGDLELRWAGLRAHNRWLADFCQAVPNRRAGIAQVMLHDIDEAVKEVHWAAKAGLTGGILLPGAPPGSGLAPLYDPIYEPLWEACEEVGLPLNHHSGSAVSPLGDQPIDSVVFMLEVTWWAHRALWHLIFAGVMERHPTLQFVFTEQGTAWIPETLLTLDYFYRRMSSSIGSQEYEWGFPVVKELSLSPSEYWSRQCHVGSSFMRPAEVGLRQAVGLDKIMWGSDYPHREGSYPYSRMALRATFAEVDPSEIVQMTCANAASVYGFDVAALAPIANRVGPTRTQIAEPVVPGDVPIEADRCPAFIGLVAS